MVGVASLGGLLFGYQTGIAAGALERSLSSWVSTATLTGAMLGAFAAGRIADLLGRRDVIMATAALFTFGAFVSAIAPSELVLLIGELTVGVGVGAISVAAPLYIAEISPIATPRRDGLHLPADDDLSFEIAGHKEKGSQLLRHADRTLPSRLWRQVCSIWTAVSAQPAMMPACRSSAS